jgi:hypothetical protein
VGLATPATLKQVASGLELRDLRQAEPVQEGPVLPSAPPAEAPRNAAIRVFGTAAGKPPVPPTLPVPGLAADDSEVTFTDLLKKVLRETADAEFQDDGGSQSNLEVLARKVVKASLSDNMGAQRARELIVERIEGKAQRANQVSTPDTALEDQIDKAAVALLNGIAKPDNES